MAEFPAELRFAESHEWVRMEADGTITVGISDHAQEELGDVVFVEFPEIETAVEAGDEAGVVESVKAASDIYAPVTGIIIAINTSLEDAPEIVNESPFDKGWFFKIQPNDPGKLNDLMDAEAYEAFCGKEDH